MPPELKKGRDMPVAGMRLVTTAMFRKVCNAIWVVFCFKLSGIDISPKTIRRARENLSGFHNVELICIDRQAKNAAFIEQFTGPAYEAPFVRKVHQCKG